MVDTLGDRQKLYYEDRSGYSLTRRSNVMIRLDGKAFHTLTRGMKRPYDENFSKLMDDTAKYVVENIQGAKIGYVQSDEISILLTDYDDIKTDAWFDYNIQKMCSISASLATAKFNQLRILNKCSDSDGDLRESMISDFEIHEIKLAFFDARVFILPNQDEVVNYFIWRQQDCTRNSISMGAQSLYSDKELKGMSGDRKQEMMFQKGVNWNDYPTRFKRGGTIIKNTETYVRRKKEKSKGILISEMKEAFDATSHEIYERSSWKFIDTPIFTQDRNIILNQLPRI